MLYPAERYKAPLYLLIERQTINRISDDHLQPSIKAHCYHVSCFFKLFNYGRRQERALVPPEMLFV